MRNNSLIATIRSLTGNAKICVWTEPMWGIPFTLYAPFVAVYMEALGLNGLQIGIVAAVAFISQMIWAPLSGFLTDKLGRRLCTFIFDILAWGIPTLLWAFARGFRWFLLAAFLNGFWRVTENSWRLLLTEDTPKDKLLDIISIVNVAGLLAAFVAPVTYLLVRQYDVVPTMRVLYLIASVSMNAKFVILFIWGKETAIGKVKREEMKGQRLTKAFAGSGEVIRNMLKNTTIRQVIVILSCFTAMKAINDNFRPQLLVDALGIAKEDLSLLSMLRSFVMLILYFVLVPRLRAERFKKPVILSFFLMAAVSITYALLPQGAWGLIAVGIILEAAALCMLEPTIVSVHFLAFEDGERARMMGFSMAVVLLMTAPFGLLSGALSNLDRRLPMLLLATLAFVGAWMSSRLSLSNASKTI